jgi:hypothetical protein
MEVSGRSPTSSLDATGETLESQIAILKAIRNIGDQRRIGLGHVHIGFLIACDRETQTNFIFNFQGEITVGPELIVASGTLQKWHGAMIMLDLAPLNLRRLMNKIYLYLEQVGLSNLIGYIKKPLDDGTFTLEHNTCI